MASTAKKYNLIAPFYDLMEKNMEKGFFAGLRKKALAELKKEILEVGIGTGKNLPYYDRRQKITGIDFSSRMLKKAAKRREALRLSNVILKKMDVEHLDFPNESFNTLVSTFVFCTVPHPLIGLGEIKRVLKKGGRAVFIEHMLSPYWFINIFLYVLNTATKIILGTSLIRKTQNNIQIAGFKIRSVKNYFFGIIRLIVAEKPKYRKKRKNEERR